MFRCRVPSCELITGKKKKTKEKEKDSSTEGNLLAHQVPNLLATKGQDASSATELRYWAHLSILEPSATSSI